MKTQVTAKDVERLEAMTDAQLKRKKKQIGLILLSRYRRGINYLRLMDLRKEIFNQQLQNGIHKVMSKNTTPTTIYDNQ